MLSVLAVHGALLIVQRSVYVPAVVKPVTVDVGEDGVVIVGVAGPEINDHDPVPTVGVFPASVTVDPEQIV
jgi:hypothetical protein